MKLPKAAQAPLIQTLLFAGIGCFASILVAIVCSVFVDGDLAYPRPLDETGWIEQSGGSIPRGDESVSLFVERQSAFGVTRSFYRQGGAVFAYQVRSGWPIRAIRGGWFMGEDGMPTYVRALPLDMRNLSWAACEAGLIPLEPIWPGLLADTAFYAVVLFTFLAGPHHVRRFVRQRRGICVQCGYDMRRAPAPVCPECGHDLTA